MKKWKDIAEPFRSRAMAWTRRGAGYYEARGYSGIAVTVSFENGHWYVFAGDNTAARTEARTLREAKQAAEKLFG